MLARLYNHHVLANLTFVLILVLGIAAYSLLPRQKDPTINFNWVQITTTYPGASAEDIEKLITDPLEEAIARVSDIRFISSTSREGLSTLLVRFEQIDERTYDKRINDLRREVQQAENSELPEEANSPFIFEITSANAFPTAILVLRGQAMDEVLRDYGRTLEKELERLKGVERVDPIGLQEPELQVLFEPARLTGLGLTPADLANTVSAYFRDTSGGTVQLGEQQWLLRLIGTDEDPAWLAALPVVTASGELPLGALAEVQRGREKAENLVYYDGAPALMLSVFKKAGTNTLDLLDNLRAYIDRSNVVAQKSGLEIKLVDDQTVSTRSAIQVMETNAAVGLSLVFLVAWVFLGARIALLTTMGIPFTLAGTFLVLYYSGETLNNSVLLGVVIALGMLVDDAVVVVDAIYVRLRHGMDAVEAGVEALREVFAPVSSSVLTTIAAFLPLMLMPGILGQFMRVIPLVVTIALVISLLEAYWMLPTHIGVARVDLRSPGRVQRWRNRFIHAIQVKYARLLVTAMRYPVIPLLLVAVALTGAIGMVVTGKVRADFFAMENYRLFYVNLKMPVGTPVAGSLEKAREVEQLVRQHLEPGDARGVVSYAGMLFTETEPLQGDHYAQILVSLNPKTSNLREVDEVVDSMRAAMQQVTGPDSISFLILHDGPPVTKPINIKVRGDDFDSIRAAVKALEGEMAGIPAITDVSTDDVAGNHELRLRVDTDAVRRAGLDPSLVGRIVRLLGDGEVVTDFQARGEKVEVRVQAEPRPLRSLDELLALPVALPGGGEIALGELVHQETGSGRGNVRHYNLRRAITLEANLDKVAMDTVKANTLIQEAWEDRLRQLHPGVELDFSGELDDINESLNAIYVLLALGIGLIYLILGAQFSSYFQPLMIIITVPMAFAGVVLGLWVTDNPLSLYTLYGVVALAGVAVNSAIVLIAAANDRLQRGMGLLHATLYAARRRVVPILITSLTTIAGLFSLATGLGGHSLLWGPVATAIVWGLAVSTLLTLFVIPVLFRIFMGWGRLLREWRVRRQLRGRVAG